MFQQTGNEPAIVRQQICEIAALLHLLPNDRHLFERGIEILRLLGAQGGRADDCGQLGQDCVHLLTLPVHAASARASPKGAGQAALLL